jgi:hypothetical protein
MNKQQANEAIANYINEAYKLVNEAQKIARDFELSFDWDLAYGMGGYYDGRDESWNPSSESC